MSNDNSKAQNGLPPQKELPVDWATEPMPVYVSGAHVVHTVREFSVLFDESAPFPGRGSRGGDGVIRNRIVSSVRIPPDVFFQVVCALASSWNRFVEQFLDAKSPRPRFKLVDSGDVQLEAVGETKAVPDTRETAM